MIKDEFRKLFFNYLKNQKELESRKDVLTQIKSKGFDSFNLSAKLNKTFDEIISIETFGDLIIFIYSLNNKTNSEIAIFSKNLELIKIISEIEENSVNLKIPLIKSIFIDSNKYLNIVYVTNEENKNVYYFACFNDFIQNLDKGEYFFIQKSKLEFGELNEFGKFFISENKDIENTKYVLIYNKSGDTGAPDYQAIFNFILFRIKENDSIKINDSFIFPQQEIANNFGLHKLQFIVKTTNDKEKIFLTWNTKDENDDLVDINIKSGWKKMYPNELDNAKVFYENITKDNLASNLKILVKNNKNVEYDLSTTFQELNVNVSKTKFKTGDTGYPGYFPIYNLSCQTTWRVGNIVIYDNTITKRYAALGFVEPQDRDWVRTPLDISVEFVYKVLTNSEPELIYSVSTINGDSIEKNDVINKWNKSLLLNVGDIEIVNNQFISSILLKSNSKWDLISIDMFNNNENLLNISSNFETSQEIQLAKNIDFITNINDSIIAFMNYQNNLLLGNVYRKTSNENLQNWNPNSFTTPWTLTKNSLNGIWSWLIRENNLLTHFIYNKNTNQIMSFTISYTNLGKENDPYLFEKTNNEEMNLNLTRLEALQPNNFSNPNESNVVNFDNTFITKTRNSTTIICSTLMNQYNINNNATTKTNFNLKTNANTTFLDLNENLNKNPTIYLNVNFNLNFRQWEIPENNEILLQNQSSTFASSFESYNENMVFNKMIIEIEDSNGIFTNEIPVKDYLVIENDPIDSRLKMYLRTSIFSKENVTFKSFKLYNIINEIIFTKNINISDKNVLNVEIEFDLTSSEI